MNKPASAWVYALAIFLSAFLLFQIQPLISRHILPWFGGSTAVWSAAMLFFQAVLLGGYAYADWLAREQVKTPANSQGSVKRRGDRVHAALLGFAGAVVLLGALSWGAPLLPDAGWKPTDASLPLLRILLALSISIGLPYFTLATTSPLLQAWYARQRPGQSPYALYALSNVGSFLALISYPLIFEPLLNLRAQAFLWAGGFLAYLVLLAWLLRKSAPVQLASPQEVHQAAISPAQIERLFTGWRRLLSILLPACSSILLLAITNQLTQEVAVIPFLWILPLSIYLLSYAITFSGEAGYPRTVVIVLLGICLLLLVYAQEQATSLGILAQILAYGAFLLLGTLALHGELYRLRPAADKLTSYYLLSSLGSVLGGLFVNLAAPFLFDGYWELPLGAALTWALAGGLWTVGKIIPGGQNSRPGFGHWLKSGLAAAAALGLMVFASVHMIRQVQFVQSGAMVSERNFYGVYRVRQIEAGEPPSQANALAHGITWHGFQYTAAERRKTPTAYYGVNSGIGLAVTLFDPAAYKESLAAQGAVEQARSEPCPQGLHVGVIGLGTGTLAAYGRPGDRFRFYEINPGIIALAEGQGGLFSFLQDSLAEITTVEGDARVALEQELATGQPNRFDILAVDAFSSDSIPIHLLTAEAFDLYLSHLQPQGVLAFHISNRYLDLQPLVGALAAARGLEAVVVASPPEDTGTYAAVWVLATRNHAFLALKPLQERSKPLPESSQPVRLWRDDYSNLVQFLRWEVVLRR